MHSTPSTTSTSDNEAPHQSRGDRGHRRRDQDHGACTHHAVEQPSGPERRAEDADNDSGHAQRQRRAANARFGPQPGRVPDQESEQGDPDDAAGVTVAENDDGGVQRDDPGEHP